MSLADVSIKRPTFITCIVLLMLAVGLLAMSRLGVDLFPDVTFPVVVVTTNYQGAGPSEIETLVSKPLEDELSTLSGIKRLTSVNREGVSQVIAEFTLETDVKFAEQQIRDRVGSTKSKLPLDVKEPIIRRIDPADQPVLTISIDADLPEAKLYDLADDYLRPKLEQVSQVGLVDVIGGRKREIHVALDRAKLKAHEVSATTVANKIAAAGENVPAGKKEEGKRETVFRTLGEFKVPDDIRSVIVNFFGSDVPVTVSGVGTVIDTLEDETSQAFVNGKKALFLDAFRQSGANTIAVVDDLRKQLNILNKELATKPGHPTLTIIRDSSLWIHANVEDVRESIMIGITLAMFVVFLFLGNGRSTIITGLALPNSLIGAFILMAIAGFTINIMTLLALSLSVGLLIDDAIVVRENIFRHIEMGQTPRQAALEGTAEVRLAVIATTLTVIAVFGPVGFLKGVVGQFFKQFGLTICFAMAISLFDALTIAPMLSAYFAGPTHAPVGGLWYRTIGRPLRAFGRLQDRLEVWYVRILHFTLRRPLVVLGTSLVLFLGSCGLSSKVTKTFLPQQDAGEFAVSLDLEPGTNLDATGAVARQVDEVIRANPEVEISALTVGSASLESNKADFYIHLVPAKQRLLNTTGVKEKLREELKPFAYARPVVKDYDAVGGGQRPFNVNIMGFDEAQLEEVSLKAFDIIRKNPALLDTDINFRPGKPEFQVAPVAERARELGVSTLQMGQELRTLVEGTVAAKLREEGREYDIRVRLQDDQRDLRDGFKKTYVPNINSNLVRLSDVAQGIDAVGPATINRQDRGRYIQISGDIAPGHGMGEAMDMVAKTLDKDVGIPSGMRYVFVGQAENFQELGESIVTAMGLGVLFIFLVLASLYESFITPLTIMLALPLGVAGSLVALYLAHSTLDIFSMIGVVMLLGISTKNSILLVDFANRRVQEGVNRADALIEAGKTRLRPILMTTMALIAGTIPIALGLNEASRQRTSMGIAIVGGLVSSTLLTLVVVPAAFSYVDRFRVWSKAILKRIFASREAGEPEPTAAR